MSEIVPYSLSLFPIPFKLQIGDIIANLAIRGTVGFDECTGYFFLLLYGKIPHTQENALAHNVL